MSFDVNVVPDFDFGASAQRASAHVRVFGYVAGLALAALLTATSFFIAGTNLVWQPSIPVALVVLAMRKSDGSDPRRMWMAAHSATLCCCTPGTASRN
jgi:hypothetical protein